MQTPVIGKCEDNRSVENASPHFYLLRHHIFLLQEFAFSDFYKLMVCGGAFGQGVSAIASSFDGRLFPSRLSQLLEDFESFLHGIFHEVCFFLILFTVKFYIFPGRFKYIFQVNIS